jgi:serine/threonine protein kinase
MRARVSNPIPVDENADLLIKVMQEIFSDIGEEEAQDWDVRLGNDTDQTWLRFRHHTALLCDQGWKLHVSANVSSAEEILRRTLPILLHEAVNFKMLSSLEHLAFLNRGGGGISQVGKFITIYPGNAEQAVKLAMLLDRATSNLAGPHVPSDHPLRFDSRVYYRYGGFKNLASIQELDGRTLPAIRNQEDQLVPDQRLLIYQAPPGITDPFIAAGIATDLPNIPRLIGKRYCLVQAIAASVNHTIFIAADLNQGRSCVIKGPGSAWQHNPFATSIHTMVRHEAEVLAQLGSHPSIPSVYDLLEQAGDLYLVIQDMEGETLEAYMTKQRKKGPLPLKLALTWARQLLDICVFIHERGFLHADLKSSNVIVSPEGQLSLIDFGIARKIKEDLGWGLGTRGYASPQLQSHQLATVQDDIYSFGALLYFLLTGAEPSLAPDPDALLQRPLEIMRPGVPSGFGELIRRCLAAETAVRYTSMREVGRLLAEISEDQSPVAGSAQSRWLAEDDEKSSDHYRHQASQLLKTLCATAEPSVLTDGLHWRSSHPHASNIVRRDIYLGNAGVVLALAELVATLDLEGNSEGREVLAQAAHWLVATFSPEHHLALAGLYTGEAGVGAALLRAGQVLQDEQLIDLASMHGRMIAALPQSTPDIMNGSAGRLRFHLLLWNETQAPEHLQAALACGEHLLETHSTREGEGVAWTIPAGFGSLSGDTLLGYAYGAAGIADALLDLYQVTNDQRFLPLITGASRWLQQQAITVLEDGSGLSWPVSEKRTGPAGLSWIHGVTGIGKFFLRLALMNVTPDAWESARQAARTVIRAARWTDPTQNHGLAGNIEFLLDMYQATGEQTFLREAHAFARLLDAFAQQQNGQLVFSSDFPILFTPDYMLGYGGIALCLLRLSEPEQMPHQLSCDGFRSHWPLGGKKYGFLSVRV